MTSTIRAAIYARVSTRDQHTDIQLHEMRQVAAQRGWVVTEYVDHGISGAKDVRPALSALERDAAAGKLDVVCVVRLDRLGRSLRHLVDLVQRLETWGCELVSLKESIDTSTPAGRLIFHVFCALGEFERELIRERTIAGVARARRQGKHIGRPSRIVSVEQARRHLASGQSLRQTAKRMGIGTSTLRRHLAKSECTESPSATQAPDAMNSSTSAAN